MISNFKKITASTVIPLIIILTLLSIGILIPILSMVIFGAIIAYYVRFVAKKIRPRVKYDTLAVFLGIIILAIPIILLLYFTLSQFLSIAGSFFSSLQQAATGNSTMNMTQINEAVQNIGLPANISQGIADGIKSGITQFISYIASSAIALVSSIPGLAAQMLILIFSIFYFARDGDKVVQYIKEVVPDKDKDFYQKVFDSADDVLKSIVVGNLIPAVILGLISVILYFLLGYPYAVLLGIISGIAMFIPIIGPWIVYGAIGIFSILIWEYIPGCYGNFVRLDN